MRDWIFSLLTYALGVTCAFGGFAIWPLYRRLRPDNRKRGLWLKRVFLLHVIGCTFSIACIAWSYLQKYPDAFMAVTYVYFVGALSIAASCGVLLVGGAASTGVHE